MKTLRILVALCLCVSIPVVAQQTGFQDSLLDCLTGKWVMRGTIDGAEITHDIESDWVLGHHYLQFHEVSREEVTEGVPAYEAIVTIGWDEPSGRYACLWLDSTGGSGLSSGVIGYAKREGDKLPFVFKMSEDAAIHNTFTYMRDSDSWKWKIDNEKGGEFHPFAKVTLTRK